MWELLAKWAEFETDRLILRPFRYSDGHDFFAIMSDPENTNFLHPVIDRLELSQQLLVETFLRKPLGIWAIEDKKTGQMIGSIRLENIQEKIGQAEIGYFLHKSFWQKGLGTESLETLVYLCFEHLGMKRLLIKTHAENKASQALAQKVGFELYQQYKGSDRHSHQMRHFKDFDLTPMTYQKKVQASQMSRLLVTPDKDIEEKTYDNY